jgi:hypothetical protein
MNKRKFIILLSLTWVLTLILTGIGILFNA